MGCTVLHGAAGAQTHRVTLRLWMFTVEDARMAVACAGASATSRTASRDTSSSEVLILLYTRSMLQTFIRRHAHFTEVHPLSRILQAWSGIIISILALLAGSKTVPTFVRASAGLARCARMETASRRIQVKIACVVFPCATWMSGNIIVSPVRAGVRGYHLRLVLDKCGRASAKMIQISIVSAGL